MIKLKHSKRNEKRSNKIGRILFDPGLETSISYCESDFELQSLKDEIVANGKSLSDGLFVTVCVHDSKITLMVTIFQFFF
jgi:hypothetical protein